jgi:hypothetical protein
VIHANLNFCRFWAKKEEEAKLSLDIHHSVLRSRNGIPPSWSSTSGDLVRSSKTTSNWSKQHHVAKESCRVEVVEVKLDLDVTCSLQDTPRASWRVLSKLFLVQTSCKDIIKIILSRGYVLYRNPKSDTIQREAEPFSWRPVIFR